MSATLIFAVPGELKLICGAVPRAVRVSGGPVGTS